jgi:HK97 gp10 family phage protein
MNDFLKAKAAFFFGIREVNRTTTRSLKRVAELILADAKKRAPVLTGALRASGRTRTLNQHRVAIEFGGRGTGVDYAQAVEFGTFRTPPKPFLQPALRAKKKEIKSTINKDVVGTTFRNISRRVNGRT